MGMRESALGLEKVAEYVDSPAKAVVSYRRHRKEYELTWRTCQENQGAQS